MATSEAHSDMTSGEPTALVIEARPSIQVFMAKNGLISIATTALNDNLDGVYSDIVQIPLDCAKQVGQALVDLAKKYGQ